MIKKVITMFLISILLLSAGCSKDNAESKAGIDITGMSSSIGAVGENTNDFETQSFKYSVSLTNNEAAAINIVSVKPILSEKFLERVSNKDTVIQVNRTISQGSSLDVAGEIIFDAKGLTKEQIIGLEPFIKEFRITEERTIKKSF